VTAIQRSCSTEADEDKTKPAPVVGVPVQLARLNEGCARLRQRSGGQLEVASRCHDLSATVCIADAFEPAIALFKQRASTIEIAARARRARISSTKPVAASIPIRTNGCLVASNASRGGDRV
jgi:hypothetical protein